MSLDSSSTRNAREPAAYLPFSEYRATITVISVASAIILAASLAMGLFNLTWDRLRKEEEDRERTKQMQLHLKLFGASPPAGHLTAPVPSNFSKRVKDALDGPDRAVKMPPANAAAQPAAGNKSNDSAPAGDPEARGNKSDEPTGRQ